MRSRDSSEIHKAHWLLTLNEWENSDWPFFNAFLGCWARRPTREASSQLQAATKGKLNDLWLHSHRRRRGLKRDADLMIFNFHSIYRWPLRPFYVNLSRLSLFACISCDPSINLNEKSISCLPHLALRHKLENKWKTFLCCAVNKYLGIGSIKVFSIISVERSGCRKFLSN